MANIWQLDKDTWVRRALDGNYASLGALPGVPVEILKDLPTSPGRAVIARHVRNDASQFSVLLSGRESRVRVNGRKPCGGLCVLCDRDEILVGGRSRFYFSTEEVASVEPFPAGERPVFCARCRQQIKAGTAAVRCPGCGHWCEQSEAKPCWVYGQTCPMCEQSTAFDTGLRWTPEEL